MDIPFGYVIALAAAVAVFALTRRLLDPPSAEARAEPDRARARRQRDRLARQHASEAAQRQAASSVSDAINDVIPMTRAQAGSLRTLLERAGRPASSAPTWWAITVLAVVAAAVAGLVALPPTGGPGNVLVVVGLAVAASVLPRVALLSMARSRSRRVRAQLPAAMDLMASVCFAGCTLDAALSQVAQHMDGPLPQEFAFVAADVSLGVPRDVALRSMADRVQVDTVNSFVTSVIEAQKTGLGIAGVLRDQAATIRTMRSLEIEEQAAKLPVKMLPVMLLGMFSTIAIEVLAPYVGSILSGIASMAG